MTQEWILRLMLLFIESLLPWSSLTLSFDLKFAFLESCFKLKINPISHHLLAFLRAQAVKNLPARQETWVQSLAWEDAQKKGMATHSSMVAWRIPRTEKPGRHGVVKSWTWLSD